MKNVKASTHQIRQAVKQLHDTDVAKGQKTCPTGC